MRPRYLLDTSAAVRIGRVPAVADAVVPLVAQGSVAICSPALLEIGYSAPASEYKDIIGRTQRTMTMIYLES